MAVRVDEETDSFVTCFQLRDRLFSLAMCVSSSLFLTYIEMRARVPVPFCGEALPFFRRVEVDALPAPLLPCLISPCCQKIRAVLSRGGKAVDLTEDHKPNAPRELERIYRYTALPFCSIESVSCFARQYRESILTWAEAK